MTDPERVLTPLAAARSLRDATRTRFDAAQQLAAEIVDEALVFTADPHTLNLWHDGFTGPSQTYADLFAQPGWQASEFRRALWRAWFTVDDWSRAEASYA